MHNYNELTPKVSKALFLTEFIKGHHTGKQRRSNAEKNHSGKKEERKKKERKKVKPVNKLNFTAFKL